MAYTLNHFRESRETKEGIARVVCSWENSWPASKGTEFCQYKDTPLQLPKQCQGEAISNSRPLL